MKILHRGKDIKTGEWRYGTLLTHKVIHDLSKDMKYHIILSHDYNLRDQLNYLLDPEPFSHVSEWVYKVGHKTVGQYINVKDKHKEKIFVGCKLRIRVFRDNCDTDKNKNHGIYYLTAMVKDVRGNLEYNKAEIEQLERPMGKEIYNQSVNYDSNLFHPYYCVENKKDENGKWLRYTKAEDSCQNIKKFYDYEII